MNALATTGMKEYWTKALSQFQKSHSRVGTMKKGMKRGPRSAQMAEASMPNDTTNRTANCATAMTISSVQYRRLARIAQGSGCSRAFQSVLRGWWASCTERALTTLARYGV